MSLVHVAFLNLEMSLRSMWRRCWCNVRRSRWSWTIASETKTKWKERFRTAPWAAKGTSPDYVRPRRRIEDLFNLRHVNILYTLKWNSSLIFTFDRPRPFARSSSRSAAASDWWTNCSCTRANWWTRGTGGRCVAGRFHRIPKRYLYWVNSSHLLATACCNSQSPAIALRSQPVVDQELPEHCHYSG